MLVKSLRTFVWSSSNQWVLRSCWAGSCSPVACILSFDYCDDWEPRPTPTISQCPEELSTKYHKVFTLLGDGCKGLLLDTWRRCLLVPVRLCLNLHLEWVLMEHYIHRHLRSFSDYCWHLQCPSCLRKTGLFSAEHFSWGWSVNRSTLFNSFGRHNSLLAIIRCHAMVLGWAWVLSGLSAGLFPEHHRCCPVLPGSSSVVRWWWWWQASCLGSSSIVVLIVFYNI